ncbi:MAG: hypothetical protein IJI21_08605 [Clostridia bacterium]|nr:hypothetical protein [Clostridia bacterium]
MMKRLLSLFLIAALCLGSALAAAPEPVTVSYLGPAGTYTEEAAGRWFETGAQMQPRDTVADAIADVLAGKTRYAVIPQENTLGGPVADYVDALIRARELYVVGEVILPISQTLMGLPGASVEEIRTVCSHAQGLTQSAAWRSEHLAAAAEMEMKSTAAAARYVAETGNPSVAAIAAPGAARLYGLEVLAENVQITDSNRTRFYVLSLHPLAAPGQEEPERTQPGQEKPGKPESLPEEAVLIVTCEASRIDDIIIELHEAGLELVMIHDRPEGSRLGSYHYVIEVTNPEGMTPEQIALLRGLESARFAGCFSVKSISP